MDWSELYPEYFKPMVQDDRHDDSKDIDAAGSHHQVEFADIGCGYGGMLGKVPEWWKYDMRGVRNK